MSGPDCERLQALHCGACGAITYFRRAFCPSCGSLDVAFRAVSGLAFVRARTVVRRTPSPELQGLAPFALFLAEADEGFRFMAHGPEELKVNDRVRCRMTSFADTIVPYIDGAASD